MALADQINTVVSGSASLVGAGSKGTPITPENLKHFYFMPVDEMFTTEITRDLVRSKQKENKLISLLDAYNVEWANEENQRQTAPNSGKTKKTRAGLYALNIQFDKGFFFQKVLESMEGSNRWRMIAIDDEDVMFGTTGKNDEFKGWQVSNFEVNPYQFKNGGEGGLASIYVQLGRASEINKNPGYITPNYIDFLPGDMDAANEVRLDITSLTGTTVAVKAILDKDNFTYAAGLTANQFLVKVNGSTVTATLSEDVEAKTYTLTVPTLNTDDKVEIKLYDSANNSPVVSVGTAPEDILYQSKEVTGVVTA